MPEAGDGRSELVDVLAETVLAMFLRDGSRVPAKSEIVAEEKTPRARRTKMSR